MVAAARRVEPRGAAKLAHHDHESLVEEPALLKVVDEVGDNAVYLGDEHLVDLVLEDMAVPGHAVGDHNKGRTVLHEVAGQERVEPKGAGAVALAVLGVDLIEIEEVGAAH